MWDINDWGVKTWTVVSWQSRFVQNWHFAWNPPQQVPDGFRAVHHWQTALYILPCTVCSVNDVLLRTHWKPMAEGFRQKSLNKLVYLAENPGPGVFYCSIIDGPHGTHYQGEGNSIIYEQYCWDTLYFSGEYHISIGQAKVRIMNEWLSSLQIVTIDGAAVARHTFWHLIWRLCL